MASHKGWQTDPHSGGRPISPALQSTIVARLNKHAETHYKGRYERLDISFRGCFCYIGYFEPIPPKDYVPWIGTYEEYVEDIKTHPTKMCRLRFFDLERWSCAFFAYSSESYKPSMLMSNEWFGTVEEGFDVGAVYFD